LKQDNQYLEIRNRTVIKANDLIQKSRFNLSLQQQKIVLYLISQISAYDEEFKLYEFSINEFCKVCGIDDTSGKNYTDLKQAIKDIADKSLWIKIEDEETLLRWIEKPYINRNSGTIKIRLDEDMKPYLLQLKENFTQYELLWTLHFRSKYTIRLYELIKSIHFHELKPYTREYKLEDLRRLLGAENYTTYQTFKARVLNPAVNEINAYSDKNIEYEPIKQGKAVVKIQFTISTKEALERIKLQSDIEKEFGLDQMTLWDMMIENGTIGPVPAHNEEESRE
jgi:plasmid replication initiation protein